MARDVQRSKVYAWEKVAYPDYRTFQVLTPHTVVALVRRVHADVRAANPLAAPATIPVKFTKRNGGCGSWRGLNFSKTYLPTMHVLHEIAHSLTYGMDGAFPTYAEAVVAKAVWNRQKDDEGHGPRFVACMIALIDRYAGRPAGPAVQTARGCMAEMMGPWRVSSQSLGDGRTRFVKTRGPEKKFISVRVDLDALSYWRNLLSKGSN